MREPAVGGGVQAVVHVERDHRDAERLGRGQGRVQQGGRIAPAAEGDGDARRAGAAVPASALGRVAEAAVGLQPLVAALHQLAHRQVADLAEGVVQRPLQERGHLLDVAMRAADRLVDDLVDQAERLQPVRRDAELLGGVGARSAVFQRMEAQPSGEITE